MRPRFFNLFLSFNLLATPALANDSTAELATGGLVILKSKQIEMRSEDLFISAKEVRIKYEFINNSPLDISTTIAFPMPVISDDPGETTEIPNSNSDNFLDFSTSVNGRTIPARAELRAYKGDREITSILRVAGVPLAPYQQKTEDALERLPEPKQRVFIKNKLVEVENYDRDNRKARRLLPRWSLATTYYFNQLFPAGKETIIEHHYRPSVGFSNVTSLGDTKEMSKSWVKEEQEKYCINSSLLNAVSEARKPSYMSFLQNTLSEVNFPAPGGCT